MKYMAMVKVGRNWSGDVFTGVMIGPGEDAPDGFKLLGKPEDTRAKAIEHAIAYLELEKLAVVLTDPK